MFPKVRILIFLALKAIAILCDNNTETPDDDIDCTDYLFDQCPTTNDTPEVEVLHLGGMEDCQNYCDNIYLANCTFFVSDLKQNLCEIWTIAPEVYETRCALHAGPVGKSGDLAKCKDNRRDCNVSFYFPQLMIFIPVT